MLSNPNSLIRHALSGQLVNKELYLKVRFRDEYNSFDSDQKVALMFGNIFLDLL